MIESQVFPIFRTDLEISSAYNKWGYRDYFVAIPQTGRKTKLTEEEFYVCSLLDGTLSGPIIEMAFKQRFNFDIGRKRLESLLDNLAGSGLLVSEEELGPPSAYDIIFQSRSPETWTKWQLLSAERIMIFLARRLRFCFSRAFVVISAVLFALALSVLCHNWQEFHYDFKTIVLPLNFAATILIVYLFVNIPGEMFRGIVTYFYGGQAKEVGLWLAFDIMPRFYCWSTVWNIRNKAHRAWVIFAPTYWALFLGSIAVLIWHMAPGESFLHFLAVVILTASMIDSCIRLNVLWPTEGYYLLSNWLEIPQFRKRCVAIIKAWIFRQTPPEILSSTEKPLFFLYGFLSMLGTLPIILVGIYFLGKELVLRFSGIGAFLLLLLIFIKYRNEARLYIKHIFRS